MESIKKKVQAYLRDIPGLIADHCNKANIVIKLVTQFFGFPVHMKVMCILYCSLLHLQ